MKKLKLNVGGTDRRPVRDRGDVAPPGCRIRRVVVGLQRAHLLLLSRGQGCEENDVTGGG
jgi:hypothetical protein